MLQHNLTKNLLLLLIVSIICLFLAEFTAKQIVSKELQYWSVFEHEPKTGWKPKSNLSTHVKWYSGKKQSMNTNKLGFRDTLNPNDIPNDNIKISVQGDSNVLGFGMETEESMTFLLQEKLNTKSPNKFNIINAGVSGFDLQNYVLQYDQIKDEYAPDHAFIIFNMGNDFLGSLSSVTYLIPRPFYDVASDGKLKLNPSPFKVQTQQYKLAYVPSLSAYQEKFDLSLSKKGSRIVLGDLVGNSYLLYFIYSRLANYGYTTPTLENLLQLEHFPKSNIETSEKEFNEASCFRTYGQYNKELEEYWKLVDQLFVALFKEYKTKFSNDALPTIVLMPSSVEILRPDYFLKAPTSCGLGDEDAAIEFYYTKFKSILDKAGLPYIDLLPKFVNRPELYLEKNEHLSEEGHKVLSEAMYEVVEKKFIK